MFKKHWGRKDTLVALVVGVFIALPLAVAINRTHPISHIINAHNPLTQWILALSSILAVAVSIWAVILLRRTLMATQDTISVTRKIGESQTRAWIAMAEPREFIGHVFSYNGTGSGIIFDLFFKNIGNMPANNISIQGEVTCEGSDLPPFSINDVCGGLGPSQMQRVIRTLPFSAAALKGQSLCFRGIFTYNDGYKNNCETGIAFTCDISISGEIAQQVNFSDAGNHFT